MLLLCMLVAGVSSVWAVEAELKLGTNNQDSYSGTISSVIEWTLGSGSGTNAPNHSNATYSKIYAGNTITIAAKDEGMTKITKIVLYATSSNYIQTWNASDNSTVSVDGSNATWTGDAASVTLTNSATGQARLNTIKITYTTNTSSTKYIVNIETPTNGTLVIKNGEEIVSSGSQIADGTVLTAVPTPADGYKLKNWQAVDASTHTYTANYTYTVNGSDVTFKANFEEIPKYAYTWYVDEKVVKTETIYEDADVEFPTVTAPSYTDKEFFGWVSTESVASDETPTCVNTTGVKAQANTSYYAVFATRTAGNITESIDNITRETTGVADQTGTTIAYTEWSDKKATGGSSAVYSGSSAGDKNTIQLRTKNSDSGIVSTTSGGTLRKIVVEWNSSTSNGRVLDVYGSSTAYSAASDLYASSSQGTKLGSITYGTSTELTVSGDYSYVGLRSNDGAMYLAKISITWENGTPDIYSDFTTTFPKATISINAACNDGNGAYYGTFYTDQAYVMHEDLAGEIVSVDENGKMSIDAVYNGGDVVPANTGLLIMALEPGDYQVNLTDETGDDWSEYNMLKGTLTADETTVGDGCLFYRLTMHEGTKIGFWWGAEDGGAFTPGANKAYLAVPNAQAARISGFSFDSDNTTTAISSMRHAEDIMHHGAYNLNGQRVDANVKGIVIVNGKKVINK